MKDHLSFNTILLLDIDDTLIKTNYLNCPNRFFRETFKSIGLNKYFYKKKYYGYNNSIYRHLVKIYNNRIENITWTLTEKNLYKEFNRWKQLSQDVWGLTARGFELESITKSSLSKVGINFSRAYSSRQSLNSRSYRSGVGSNQIIYTGGDCKGTILKEFEYNTNSIIMVDDSLENLEAVKVAAEELNLVFKGLHYVRN